MTRLQKEVASYKSDLKKAVEKEIMDFRHSEEGKNYLEVQRYPPAGEEPTFLDLAKALYNVSDPFAEPSIPGDGSLPPNSEGDLDNLLGEVEAEVRSHPNEAAIDFIEGDLQCKRTQNQRKKNLTWLAMLSLLPPMCLLLMPHLRKRKKISLMGKKMMMQSNWFFLAAR
ncbi:UNVERIFIED_CONTAM: hypothetical protein Sindi_1484200 [Sesamum indicum]